MKAIKTNRFAWHILLLLATLPASPSSAATAVEQFQIFESTFHTNGQYANPYTELAADAQLTSPDGQVLSMPLFWDGANVWRLRFSPNRVGHWSLVVRSRDTGLDSQTGSFECVASARRGSLQRMPKSPRHFQYQNGERMWFLGDTAWALFTDNAAEKHDRAAAEAYLTARASQGFNVVHSMLLSEAGWGNSGGLPFDDIAAQRIQPGYWQEVDRRLAFANARGTVIGLALAWGDKRKQEPFAWRRFPDRDARLRYARYCAARFSAYDVYFLVSGEWHGEIRTRPSTEDEVRREFIEIGNTLAAADPHDRLIGIHPMTREGTVREFNQASWMGFGDYQQNYQVLHQRMLDSRRFEKPVVNSEYGYFLRDQSGDGQPDKDNSTSLESMRHASWDIAMASGYLVTGFGTTYFGGNRDPGPFDLDAAKNDPWELQAPFLKQFFSRLEWWKLEPHDEWLSCSMPRGKDTRQLDQLAPPTTTYWLIAEPGQQIVVYCRGVTVPIRVATSDGLVRYRAELFNPRTGDYSSPLLTASERELSWSPPSAEDWVLQCVRERTQ